MAEISTTRTVTTTEKVEIRREPTYRVELLCIRTDGQSDWEFLDGGWTLLQITDYLDRAAHVVVGCRFAIETITED